MILLALAAGAFKKFLYVIPVSTTPSHPVTLFSDRAVGGRGPALAAAVILPMFL